MATGDITLFEEFADEIGEEIHNLASDTLKFGIIDNTAAPTAADETPRWADYSANEVSTAGGYTANGVTLTTVTYTEAAGVATLKADSFTLSQNGSGFTDAYWGIIYNDTAVSDQAIGFMELGGPVSEQSGDVVIKFNNVASGSPGDIFTLTVNP
jgi:hypothetical protein